MATWPGIANEQVARDAYIPSCAITLDPTQATWGGQGLATYALATGVDPTSAQWGRDPIAGDIYWHEIDGNLRIYTSSAWSTVNSSGSGDNTLNDAYDQGGAGSGRTITVTDGAFNLDGNDADSSIATISQEANTSSALVTLTHEHASSTGTILTFSNAGTGNDITADNWSVTKAGAAAFVGVTDTGGITTDTSLTTTGTGTLSVAGTSTLTGNVTMGGDATVAGNSTVTGNLTVNGTLSATVAYADANDLTIGTGNDLRVGSDGTNVFVSSDTAGTVLNVGSNEAGDTFNDIDITVYGSASGKTIKLDASADKITSTGIEWVFTDNDNITFGTGEDVSIRWDGTDLDMTAAVDDSVFKIGNGTNSFDVWIYGNAAGDTTVWDASANTVTLNGFDLYLLDDDNISFGDSQDVVVQWAAAGGLNVTGAAADSVITIGADGANTFDLTWHGSGAGDDIVLDASANTLKFDGIDVHHEDSDLVVFGDDADFTMVGTSNNLEIYGAADNDTITIGWKTTTAEFDVDVKIMGNAAANYALFDASANTLDLTNNIQLLFETSTPASAAAAGTAGNITYDANYIYVATATNTWKRVAIATW